MKYLLHNQETERILFREIRETDYNDWLEFHKNPDTSLHWISEFKSPEIECKMWYEKQFYRYKNNLGGMNALLEKQSGKLIGHCGLLIQNVDKIPELEIGYSILAKYWNRGFATESAKKCRDYAFENNLSNSLISIISLSNKASQAVAVKNGMSVDKVTEYRGNKVNVDRIDKTQWKKIKLLENKDFA